MATRARGLMAILTSPGPSGAAARQLLAVAVLLPLVLGGLALAGERQGLYSAEMALALLAVSTVIALVVLVGGNARSLHRAEAKRERALEAAKERELWFRSLMEAAPDAIVIVGQDGRIVLVNAQTEALFGYARGELLGQPLEMLVPARYRDRHIGHRAGFFASPRTRAMGLGYELMALRKDGSEFPTDVGLSPLATAEGPLLIAAIRDMTEHKRAAAALQDSEARYRSLFEESRDAIFIVTRTGQFTDANSAWLDLFGYASPELAGLNLRDCYGNPEDQHRLREEMDQRGAVVDHEVMLRRKDGALLDCLVSAAVRHAPDGSALGYQGIIRDVTERKRLEEQVRLWQRTDAIGRLAGGIAHDFNNLLTVIRGRSQLLLARLGPEDPARRDVELVDKTAGRAADLTRQLLAFGRRQILEPHVLDLNGVVSGIEPMLRRLIGEDINLTATAGLALGRVKVDPGQLEQVIVNLAANARDAMPGGGRLTIETANVELDEAYARAHLDSQPGSYVMLAVSDTGTGMDAATRARAFEPFFTTKEPGKGTGLGLATVYGIVKQSGGNIWIYSEPGQGTSFKIYFPRVDEPAEAMVAPGPAAPLARGTETILLVEDDDEVRGIAREVLEAQGYTVIQARDPGEALLMARRNEGPIGLLLTDVVMPRMSGRALATELAPLRPETAVLYISGYTDDAIVHHGLLDPGIPFLQKPFTPEGLARKVRETLDRARLATGE